MWYGKFYRDFEGCPVGWRGDQLSGLILVWRGKMGFSEDSSGHLPLCWKRRLKL